MNLNCIAFTVVFAQFVSLIQGQALCGQFQCAPNAVCENNLCICATGYRGSGRFLCVLDGTRCPCITFGDPHTLFYDGQRIRSIIPCEFTYTGFVTPAVASFSCDVQVRLVTVRRATQANPFRQFVKELVATVIRDNTRLDFTAGSSGITGLVVTTIPGTDNVAGVDITPVVSTVGQIRQVSMAECDTVIGFNPSLGSGFVDAIRTSTFPPEGLCGNCDGVQNDIPFDSVSGATTAEKDLAWSLRQLSNEQTTSDSTVCTGAKAAANLTVCLNDATLIAAVRACGIFIMDSTYRDCLVTMGIGNKENLFLTFKDCLTIYCTPNAAAACAIVASLTPPAVNCAVPTGYVCT